MINIAINGYGRIGRNVLRALYEAGRTDEFRIVAINDLGDAKTNAHLTKYDTVHGRFNALVEAGENALYVNGDEIRTFAERNPANLPWADLGVDVVFECTGIFRSKSECQAHIDAGAKKVIISAPGKGRGCNRRLWREPRHPDGRHDRYLQRLLHHQLPGAGGQAS